MEREKNKAMTEGEKKKQKRKKIGGEYKTKETRRVRKNIKKGKRKN